MIRRVAAERIAAQDEVDQIGEPLTFRASDKWAAGKIALVISCAKLPKVYRGLGVGQLGDSEVPVLPQG